MAGVEKRSVGALRRETVGGEEGRNQAPPKGSRSCFLTAARTAPFPPPELGVCKLSSDSHEFAWLHGFSPPCLFVPLASFISPSCSRDCSYFLGCRDLPCSLFRGLPVRYYLEAAAPAPFRTLRFPERERLVLSQGADC